MQVSFVANRTFKSHCFTYPLRAWREQLIARGFRVGVYHRFNGSALECDVLCVVGDYFHNSKLQRDDVVELVEKLRSQVSALVWCDVSDSTGTCSFELLPIVDLYLKNQLLKDRTLYTRHLYGLRPYTDYYNRVFGIRDAEEKTRQVASLDHLDKLAVSWNIGLGDYSTFSRFGRAARIWWPWCRYRPRFTPASDPRNIHLSYRAKLKYKRASVSFQRQETQKQIDKIKAVGRYSVAVEGRIPYPEYRRELARTAIAPSPFGLGEICFRDFECFLSGNTVVKPAMDHLETWPSYYLPEQTYIPHSWDFADFQSRIEELLQSPQKRIAIARAGQERYLRSLSPAGGEAFAARFTELVDLALSLRTRRLSPVSVTALGPDACAP